MKIYFASYHKYPGIRHGVAAHAVHDYLVKGLSELGHEVFYHLKEDPRCNIGRHVNYTDRIIENADIFHINSGPLDQDLDHMYPWVKIIHSDIRIQGLSIELAQPNWIYVSRTLAKLYGSKRFVLNGIDPADFTFSAKKDNYLFFIVGGLDRAKKKGLEFALEISKRTKLKLLIAGTHTSTLVMKKFAAYCKKHNAEFIGPVFGKKKADLFAYAKATIFPSQYNEACPLVVAESLMSGTPVISSDKGALPELVNSKVGITCGNIDDYVNAALIIDQIDPSECRQYALEHFHYIKMAENYLAEYKKEILKISVTI